MSISADIVETADDEMLRQQIVDARRKLGGLEQDLGGIDAELEGLGEQRTTYELLERACGTLEELEGLGAGDLFWGADSGGRTVEHVRDVRDRASSYLGRIDEIEKRRSAVVAQIKDGQEVLEILEGDLFELELAEEERQQEWIVDREPTFPEHVTLMPWARTENDQRLRKSLATNLLIALLIGAIIPMIKLPLPPLDVLPEVPDRFARLIEKQPPPPPTPPPQEIVEEAPPEKPVEPEQVAEETPKVVPESTEEPAAPAAEEPAPKREVRSAGILAFSDSFADLADERPAAQLGAQARINDAGEAEVGRTERAMVTSQAPGSSGGINLASLSRDVGGSGGAGDQIDGVQVTRVASSIGAGGTGDRPTSAGAAGGRTDEEIQIVFDRYKAALYRLYNRELRNDPTLRGQVVLKLTIEPDGSVSFCAVDASDLGDPTLEGQIVERVKTFDFGAKEGITAVTILYPIDFLPAA